MRERLPWPGKKRGPIEVYSDKRYLTVTGRTLPDGCRAIGNRQSQLDQLIYEHWGDEPRPTRGETRAGRTGAATHGLDYRDQRVLTKARDAVNGEKFTALFYEGDLSAHGGDQSAADLALANMLMYWTNGDRAQADRLFRVSALMRQKWDDKHFGDGGTYGQGTLERAGRQHSGRTRSSTRQRRRGA